LVVAQQKGELWSIAPDKKVTVLVATFEGKQFNGPNDLWISPDGGVYFTDPFYQVRFMTRDPKARMDGQHVYFLAPDRKTLKRVADDLFQPNGIIGTPDGKTLYIGDFGGSTWAYDIQPDGELANKRLFYDGGSDGMTIDVEGNVYLTRNGVIVLDKTGKKIEQIDVPAGSPSNVTFGGKDRDLLFITAESYLYGLKMRVRGR
jgi:gluconolactonase